MWKRLWLLSSAALLGAACMPAVPPTATQPVTPTISATPGSTSPALATSQPTLPGPPDAPIIATNTLPWPGGGPEDRRTPFPTDIAVTDGALWIQVGLDPTLLRIDLDENRITATQALDWHAILASDGRRLWVHGPYGYAPGPSEAPVVRIDVQTGVPREIGSVRRGGNDFVAGLGSLWAVGDGGLWRLDPRSGEHVATLEPAGYNFQVGCGALWATDDAAGNSLLRLDPETGETAQRLAVGGEGGWVLATEDACWLASSISVQRIESDWSLGERTLSGVEVMVAGSSAWTITEDVVRRIDLERGTAVDPGWRIDSSLLKDNRKGERDWRLIDAGGSLWLVNGDQLTRFDIATR